MKFFLLMPLAIATSISCAEFRADQEYSPQALQARTRWVEPFKVSHIDYSWAGSHASPINEKMVWYCKNSDLGSVPESDQLKHYLSVLAAFTQQNPDADFIRSNIAKYNGNFARCVGTNYSFSCACLGFIFTKKDAIEILTGISRLTQTSEQLAGKTFTLRYLHDQTEVDLPAFEIAWLEQGVRFNASGYPIAEGGSQKHMIAILAKAEITDLPLLTEQK